jgi:hypothetical protein
MTVFNSMFDDVNNVVWEAKLDDRFDCKVVRDSINTGILTVVDPTDGKVLLDKSVFLSYGAQFGPDVDDVRHWEDLCAVAVDTRNV